MKKDTKIIKAIVQCILEYSMLKSGNISTEIPSGVAYQLPTRDFIRAWMQSHYNIIKLSGYFYRRFKKIFDNVDYWREQIDQNNQNENNINETFNNEIQAQKDNIENTLAELDDLSKQNFITKFLSKLKDNGFTVNIENNTANSNFSFGEIKDANFNDHNHYDVPEILISWFSTKRSHGKAGYAILCIKLYDDYFCFSGIIYRQKSTTNFKDFIHTDFESSIIFPKNQDDSVNDVSCIIPFKGLNTKDTLWRYTYNYYNLYNLIETINYLWSIRNKASKLIQPVSKCKYILNLYKRLIQNTYDKYTNQKITETFNNDIQSQEDNIDNSINDLGLITRENFKNKLCEELQKHGYKLSQYFSYGKLKDIYINKFDNSIQVSWFSGDKRRFGKYGYGYLNIEFSLKYFYLNCLIYRQKNYEYYSAVCQMSHIYLNPNQNLPIFDKNILPFNGDILPLASIEDAPRYTYSYNNLHKLISFCCYLWSIRDEASSLLSPLIDTTDYDITSSLVKIFKDTHAYNKKKLYETFNNNIQSQEDDINGAINDLSYIKFKDPEVEQICHEKLHVYTYEDAKKVTNLCNFGRNIKYFNELKYFTNLKKINDYAFAACSQLKQITLPDSITEIGMCAFNGCTDLLKINIPKNVIKIDDEAFFFCQSLKQIIISNDECKIGEETFGYCKSLEEIILPKNITEIPDSTFYYCSSLKHINIPNKVTKIGDVAFYQCESLQYINIPNKVIKIGNSAFEYCKSLQSIIIPDNIMEIGQDVFTYCDNLRNIYVSEKNYEKLKNYKFKKFLKINNNSNSNLINETFNNEIQSKDDSNIDQAIENISVSKNIISQDNFYQLLLKFLKNNKFIDESKETTLGIKQWYGHHEKGYYYNKYLPPKVENENEIYSMHTLNIVLVDIPQINEDTEQHQHDIVYIKILSNPNLDYDIDKDSNTFNITLNYAPNILPKDDLGNDRSTFSYKIQYPILDMNYEKMINLNGYFTYRMSTAAVYDIKNIITKMFYNNNYLKDLLINDYEVLGYPCLDDVRFKKYIDGFLDRCHF